MFVVASSAVVPTSAIEATPILTASLGAEMLERVLAASQQPWDPSRAHKRTGWRYLLAPGGVPWEDANQVLRQWRGKEMSTQADYTSDLKVFGEWCWANGIEPRLATFQDLLDYRDERLYEDMVRPGTWNRNLASIGFFFEHLKSLNLIATLPFSRIRDLRARPGARPLRVTNAEGFLLFRDVGLRGLDLRDGGYDPRFRAITPERDGLFADLLVSSGVRRVEGSHLLLLDLLARVPGQAVHLINLPDPICKNSRGRTIKIPEAWFRRLRLYHSGEWFSHIQRAQRALRRRRADLLIVDDYDAERVTISGRTRRLDALQREDRRRMVATADVGRRLGLRVEPDSLVPLSIFPGTRWPGVSPTTWTLAFADANRRVDLALKRAGLQPVRRVTPHVLRHTFATEYLDAAVAELKRASMEQRPSTNDYERLKKHLTNPLLELKGLLGHADLSTTLIYLDHVARRDPLSDQVYTSWTDAFLATTAREGTL